MKLPQLNGLLFIAIIILLLISWFEPGLTPEKLSPLLTSLHPKDIHTIHLQRHQLHDIDFEKTSSHWMMQKPIPSRINPIYLDTILDITTAKSQHHFLAKDKSLTAYQLDKPLAVLRLNDMTISFGGADPLGKYRYVLINDTIHLINDSFYYSLRKPYTEYIDLSLFPAGAKIQQLQLPSLQLIKQGKNWQLSPEQVEVSTDTINQFIHQWEHISALKIQEYHSNGLKPEVSINWKQPGADTIKQRMEILYDEQALGFADKNIRYHFSKIQFSKLLHLHNDAPSHASSL